MGALFIALWGNSNTQVWNYYRKRQVQSTNFLYLTTGWEFLLAKALPQPKVHHRRQFIFSKRYQSQGYIFQSYPMSISLPTVWISASKSWSWSCVLYMGDISILSYIMEIRAHDKHNYCGGFTIIIILFHIAIVQKQAFHAGAKNLQHLSAWLIEIISNLA